MKNKVVITKLPKGQSGPGLNLRAAPWSYFIGKMSEPALEVKSTLKPVPRDQSNLEAELGEVVMLPEAGGIPNTFKVGGSRHSNGGTPLNLPEDSFIFSDTQKLKIKDKKILAQFGIPETKAGVTPAAIAKKYDIGVYKKILLDKTTDKLQRETAEKMIANYNLKLAKLALIQESMKGFPQGLPQVAMPYIEAMQIDPSIFVQANPGGDSEVSQTGEADQMQGGGVFEPTVQKGNRNFFNTAVNFIPYVETAIDAKDVWQGARSNNLAQLNQGILGLTSPLAGKAFTGSFDYLSDKMIGTDQTDININKRDNIINMGNVDRMKLYTAYGPGGFDKWKKDGFPNLNTKVDDDFRIITPAATKVNSNVTIRKSTHKEMGGSFDHYQMGGGFPLYPYQMTDQGEPSNDEFNKINKIYSDTYYENQAIPLGKDFGLGIFRDLVEGLGMNRALKEYRKYVDNEMGDEVPQNLEMFQDGGQTYSKGNKVFVYDPETGKHKVFKNGRLIGYYTQGPNKNSRTPVATATVSSKPTYKVNIPTSALTFSDPNDPNIKPEDVAAGKVYISKDGKWYKATGYQPKAATSKFTDPRISRPELNSSYGQLADMFNDPANEDLRKDLVADYRTKVAALKPTKHLTQADIDTMSKLDDAGVIKNFLDHELQIFALHSAGIDGTKDTSGQWDKDRKVYQNAATKLGFTPSTSAQTAAFQAAYKSLVDLSSGKYKDKLQDFELKPIGKADEGSGKNSNISGIDGWFGNTTVGQAAKYKPKSQSLLSEEVKPDVEYPLVKESLQTPELPDGAPWWLQDIIKTSQAASNYAKLRQYEPWQATAPVVTPDVTFADPTRELAANAESVNEAVNTIAAFTGPQAFNARFSELQGNAMKGAADILGRYNNLNIGLSNQQSSQNAQLMNVANQQRANEQTTLWDKYQMTRQQFDNAKTQAKDAMVDAYTTGLTNKANTYNLNQMYPQFAIDPMSGGNMYFRNPRQFFPKNESDTPDVSSIFNRLLQEIPAMSTHPEKVLEIASKMAGLNSKDLTYDDYVEMMKKSQGSAYPTQ